VDGYKSEVHGYDITNTKVAQTTVEGMKTWKDGDATNRPKTIKVDLLQNGRVIATQEVTEASGWKYEFKDQAAYDAEGNAYKYEVKEQPVDGYKSEVHGYDITNTKVAQTTVEGTKTWKDGDATNRPKTIKVDLLQNGQVIVTQEVTEATGWKYTFKDQAAYDAEGNAYKYEVKEQPVDGYKSEVKGYDITNIKIKDETVVPPQDNTDTKDGTVVPPQDNTDTKDGTVVPPQDNTDTKDGTVVPPQENTNTKDNLEVPPTKESDKTSLLLPKTGGVPTEIISIGGGILLLVSGILLFVRRRVQ
ncbi:Cna B-type domain-containing protein, partial [Bacillus pretiosus]|uniref:Cna B-type domain-containing protein n=1 Tax=Bacillus pretiosus TaxID=2983392 RepID=UPI003D657227